VPAIPDTQAPTIPGGLSAKAVDYLGVSLTWTAARDDTGVAGYTIYRDGTQLATVPAASTSYTDKSVAPTTVYNYSIDAFDPAGNHSPASASVEIATPTAPTSLTFFPTADTYVNADSPGTNYGGSTALRIDSSPDTHAYLRFTVSGLLGRSVARARLLVYANSNGSQGVDLRTVAGSTWDELTASYSDAPSLGNILASSGAFSSGDWIALDVTQYISGEGTYNFGLTTSGSTAISLSSREAGANAPQLVLDLQR